MPKYFSKQETSLGSIDPIYALLLAMLIVGLVVFSPLNATTAHSLASSNSVNLSSGTAVSFTTDQQYWEANCSHGWDADSACDNIVLRVQACYTSFGEIDSAYCSEYQSYLQRFQERPLASAN